MWKCYELITILSAFVYANIFQKKKNCKTLCIQYTLEF